MLRTVSGGFRYDPANRAGGNHQRVCMYWTTLNDFDECCINAIRCPRTAIQVAALCVCVDVFASTRTYA